MAAYQQHSHLKPISDYLLPMNRKIAGWIVIIRIIILKSDHLQAINGRAAECIMSKILI